MEAVVEKTHYEIERGKPMPSKLHSHLQFKIGKLIDRKYEDQFDIFPELSLSINKENKIPDLALFKTGVIDLDFDMDDEIKVSEIPLCVVEILSPTQSYTELIIKSRTYFDAGIQSYWLVLPALKTIYVFSKKDEYEVYSKTDILLDNQLNIELDLGKLFAKK